MCFYGGIEAGIWPRIEMIWSCLSRMRSGEEEDEVLAVYEAKGGEHGWKSKGRLLIKEGGGEQWELMVILTAMALIVSKRREQ